MAIAFAKVSVHSKGKGLSSVGSVSRKLRPAATCSLSDQVAYSQIEKTGNKKLILGQEKALHFVAKKMSITEVQKKKAGVLADKIVKHYGKSWPAPSTILTTKDYPAPCSINY